MNNNKGKATVMQDFNGLSISIPTSTPIFILLISILTLSFMLYSGLYEVTKNYLSTIDHRDYVQIMIALVFVFIIFSIIKTWLWLLFGKQMIEITNQQLKIKNSILGMGKFKIIPISDITQVSVNIKPTKQQPGKILLHRGAKVINVGTYIQTEESVYLVELIKNKLETINSAPVQTNFSQSTDL